MGVIKSFMKPTKVLNAAFPVFTYSSSRKEGKGIATSTALAAKDYILYSDLMGPLGWALMAKDVGVATFKQANKVGLNNARISSKAYNAQFGGHFQDTSNAHTMRQRGIQAIQNNGLNNRSVLGSEARQFYRSGV